MLKRAAAAFLWYAMVWIGYEIAWSISGAPRMIGPILAATVAMIIVVDPLHLFWPRSQTEPEKSFRLTAPGLDNPAANAR